MFDDDDDDDDDDDNTCFLAPGRKQENPPAPFLQCSEVQLIKSSYSSNSAEIAQKIFACVELAR